MEDLNYAKRLRKLREERHYSQQILEDLTGIDRTTISAYELGIREPSLENFVKLARVYRVSLDYLYGLSTEKCINYSNEPEIIYQKALAMLTQIDLNKIGDK